jgi:HKD family nuclease
MLKPHATLLLNGDTKGHRERLLELLAVSTRFECVVAFAKMSGWAGIAVPMTTALKRGLKARFTVGMSFYQTEPALVEALLKLSRKYSKVEVFVGDPEAAFHPKICTFGGRSGGSAIVGSANLTSGGLNLNYEASMEIEDADGALLAEVAGHVDMLIEQKVIVRVTPRLIDDYARKFEINRIHQAVARRRTSQAIDRSGFDIDTLQAALDILRNDRSETGFDASRPSWRCTDWSQGRRRRKRASSTVTTP